MKVLIGLGEAKPGDDSRQVSQKNGEEDSAESQSGIEVIIIHERIPPKDQSISDRAYRGLRSYKLYGSDRYPTASRRARARKGRSGADCNNGESLSGGEVSSARYFRAGDRAYAL